MTSSTRRSTSKNPREDDQGPRGSARITKKQPGSHPSSRQERQTKRPVTPKDAKVRLYSWRIEANKMVSGCAINW
jgi:hypothetical protein